jgi:hypothetical protein
MIPIPNMAHYLNTPSTPLIRSKKKKKEKIPTRLQENLGAKG